MSESDFILYPSNWLYNAGVVGLLSCLDREDYLENYQDTRYTMEESVLKINRNVFDKIKVQENYFNTDNNSTAKVTNLATSNKGEYPNFAGNTGQQKNIVIEFVKNLKDALPQDHCSFCDLHLYIDKNKITNNDEKFFKKIEFFNMTHNKLLASSTIDGSSPFPNAFWNCDDYNDLYKICHLCTFILIHHHLAFTKLSDGSEIFVNAPSFKVMYELNKLINKMYEKKEGKTKREILAMSVIEYARRIQTTLSHWTAMNIEIVIKYNNRIEFYSLPYDVVNIISDRTIATLLSDIGEFSVLNAILDSAYNILLDMSHDFIKISTKEEENKADKELINRYLKRNKNKENLLETANKILRLYANIIERRKRYGRAAK